MPLPLPNLDTRRWADLVDEGRALIPRHAPGWTDHNVHDPGITLVELFAWLVEQLIYRANRVPERHLRKFLALAGFAPEPPRPATAVLGVQLAANAGTHTVPAGTPFAATASDGRAVPFVATAPTTLVEAALVAAQSFDGERFVDRTRALREGTAFPAMGADPRAPRPYDAERAPALYLGFDRALPPGSAATLWLHPAAARAGEGVALDAEEAERRAACDRPTRPCAGGGAGGDEPAPPVPPMPAPSALHHSARTAWDYREAPGWRALDPRAQQVDDRTRALTLDAPVRLAVPTAMAAMQVGAVSAPLFWIRCRLVRGSFDDTPVLTGVTLNAVAVEQARAAWHRFPIAAGTVPAGAIAPGARLRLAIGLDERGVMHTLAVEPPSSSAPELLVLDYTAPTATAPGSIALPLVQLGTGSGLPEQHLPIEGAPVARGEVAVHTIEGTAGAARWRAWTARADLDASGETEPHASIAPAGDEIRFGDGRRGRVPPDGAAIVAAYAATMGTLGEVSGGRPWRLDDDPVAHARLGASFAAVAQATVGSRLGAAHGSDAEPVGHAAARAAAFLWAHERLVELCQGDACSTLDQLDGAAVRARPAPARATTALDLERIALDVPGTRVRRARAWTALDPVEACLEASGTVTLVIVPALPRQRPSPSPGLLRAVRRWVDRRRVLCTRVVVVGPSYLDVSVRATVRALRSADADRVRAAVASALDGFLDPLTGGPAGRGWPFGRDVYRSEILQVIDAVPGVDHVLALSLAGRAGDEAREAASDKLCLPPTWLVSPAAHAIDVVPA